MHATPNTPEAPGFIRQQLAFATRVRDPENSPLPAGVEARRMAVYEELIYNNIDEFLHNAFPVLHTISSDEYWQRLVRDFLVHHRARTPLFPELPLEFLSYLEHTRIPQEDDHPFLLELAHYEWAELAMSICEATFDEAQVERHGSLLDEIPVLSPLVWLCRYDYPVHRIGPDFLPEQAGEHQTHLMIYRDREEEVGFMELNAVTVNLLQRLEQNATSSGNKLLLEMTAEMQHPNPHTVIAAGLQIMQELKARDVILGTRK